MKEVQIVETYSPKAGTSTQVPRGTHVTQAARDAFWMATLGGDPYLFVINGAEHVEHERERRTSGDAKRENASPSAYATLASLVRR